MNGATQRRKERSTRSGPLYVLRFSFASAVLLLLSTVLIVDHLAAYLPFTDLLLFLVFVLIFYSVGGTFDKKLALGSFRFYKWMVNRGLLEESESDLELEKTV